ncbi:MAG: MBL fold metallo-hydrolase [Opitutales bacterium]
MKVTFWGSRGSIPTPTSGHAVREKVFQALKAAVGRSLETDAEINAFINETLPFSVRGHYGGNTSCLEISNPGGEIILCDAGSGIREFATRFMTTPRAGKPATFHIFMSHLHWDHIQGFPFFVPAYIPGNRIIFHGFHQKMEEVFRRQMDCPWFPVPFETFQADIEFDVRAPGDTFSVGGFEIDAIEQSHPGVSYGYRFRKAGKRIVYSSDSEHRENAYEDSYPFVEFFKDADLLIFDAQYSLADATFDKANWGHSSNVMGVELSARARAKHLVIFHHEPTNSDETLDKYLFNTRMYADIYFSENRVPKKANRFPREISLAYDGMVVEI